eukprot:CAMPEP_0177764016 /NCGR_PEP_ID=MMETSP0491_2-20121128/7173_1 /TAXON_ID=63592 /ORGANISM="Tetraselmis chuii, Strain PLY429" /LENGTH=190 /DNA_ID=CAMNT_0019280149 /DNA_START=347 /DNA_END=918 /DNA_ORIENTATION=+
MSASAEPNSSQAWTEQISKLVPLGKADSPGIIDTVALLNQTAMHHQTRRSIAAHDHMRVVRGARLWECPLAWNAIPAASLPQCALRQRLEDPKIVEPRRDAAEGGAAAKEDKRAAAWDSAQGVALARGGPFLCSCGAGRKSRQPTPGCPVQCAQLTACLPPPQGLHPFTETWSQQQGCILPNLVVINYFL